MTVKSLIKELEKLPENLPVGFAYDYGDYINTIKVVEIQGVDVTGLMIECEHPFQGMKRATDDDLFYDSEFTCRHCNESWNDEGLDYDSAHVATCPECEKIVYGKITNTVNNRLPIMLLKG